MFCKKIIELCLLFSFIVGLVACDEEKKEEVFSKSTHADMEWIDLGEITFAKAIRSCPSGWHLASRGDWDRLLSELPSKKFCECAESGEFWIGEAKDCRQKYCETCMSCSFKKLPVVDELVASGFLKDGKEYWTIEESQGMVTKSTMLFRELFAYEYDGKCEKDQCPKFHAKCVRRVND